MTACRKYKLCNSLKTVGIGFARVLTLAIALGSLTACMSGSLQSPEERGFVSKIFSPYRPDVVQGNFISKEQMETVRVGMSKEQVKQLLGTPLLNDIFHADRWDYVFVYKRGDTQQVEQRKATLFFKGMTLASIDAPDLPSEKELISEIDYLRANRRPQKTAPSQAEGAAAKMAPTVPNPTSGVGIPSGGNRQDSN